MIIFFSITDKNTTIKEIETTLKNTIARDFSLKIACEKNHPIVEEFSKRKRFAFPISLDIFSVGTSEEAMIEYSVKNMPADSLLLVRNNTKNFSENTVDAILTEAMQGYDVVMLKKRGEKKGVKKFFSDIGNSLCKTFFNFKHYEGDIGIQYFSSQAQTLLRNTNVNLMSKLNRWLALNVRYVEMDIKKTKFPKNSYKKPLIKSGIYAFVFVLTLVLAIVFGVKITWTFITTLVVLLVAVTSVAMSLFHALDIYNVSRVGAIHFKRDDAIETRQYPKSK